jgi:hypothetical protein
MVGTARGTHVPKLPIRPNFPIDDPIARLLVHYFEPCDFFFDQYRKARVAITRKGGRTWEMDWKEARYRMIWLASLYAVYEGYKDLRLSNDKVDYLAPLHIDSLRILRNGTFRYQPTHSKQTQFFTSSDGRGEWAESLQAALRSFFSEYRVNFMVKEFIRQNRPTTLES